jgi:hypothetical protein
MRIRVIGEALVELPSGNVSPAAPHLFALLLRLSAEPKRLHPRGTLAPLLFPLAEKDADALHSLRQLLYQARRRGVPINTGPAGISLGASVASDFEDAVGSEEGIHCLSTHSPIVLPGYSPSLSNEFSEWVESFRERCHTRLRHSLTAAICTLRDRAEWSSLELRARQCLALDPLNEQATLGLAEALARTGSKERALNILEAYGTDVSVSSPHIAIPASLLRKRIDAQAYTALHPATSPLIGRSDSFAALSGQWHMCERGKATCILIRGETGAGKSRLLDEFLEGVRLQGNASIAVLRRSKPDTTRPYGLVAGLLSRLLQLPGAAGCDPTLLPFLHRLKLSTGSPEEAFNNPEQHEFVRNGIARAWADLLEALCSEKPCLICIDDSRCIDGASLSLIRHSLDALHNVRVCFLIACADTEARSALTAAATHTVALGPLAPVEASTLVSALFQSSQRVASQAELEWCISMGVGNPALLNLATTHVLAGFAPSATPRNMADAMDARLAAISDVARRILEACVVLADHCDVLLLARVMEVGTLPLTGALHELERAGFVTLEGSRVVVRSSLLRDRVSVGASKVVWTLLHARCAALLAERADDTISPSLVAFHWHSAGFPKEARKALTTFWKQHLQLGQPTLAEASIRALLAQSTDANESIALLEDLIEVAQAAGNYDATIEAIDARSGLLRAFGGLDPRQEALAADRLDALLLSYADPTAFETTLRTFVRSSTLDEPRRLRAALRLMVGADASADAATAEEVYRDIGQSAASSHTGQVFLDQALLIFHSVFGSKTEALRLAGDLVANAKSRPDSWPHMRGMVNASLALQLAGDSSESIEHLETCYSRLRTAGMSSQCLLVSARLASFHLDDGDIEAASKWGAIAESYRPLDASRRLPSDYLSVQADLAMLVGNFALARNYVDLMRHASPLYNSLRFQMEISSYSLRLSQFEGKLGDDNELDGLLTWHYRARSFGRHDDDMDAIWVGLVARGREAQASTLLHEYLSKYRRETRPCRYMLQLRTVEDLAWNSPAARRYRQFIGGQ